jgi:hypothetical protein
MLAILISLGLLQAAWAGVDVKGSVAAQVTRKAEPASTAKIDNAFIRAEVSVGARNDQAVEGLIQLRTESGLGSKDVSLTVRQAFFQLPIARLNLKVGRWYEVYSAGAYFGRWLAETSPVGSGSFCVNYTIWNGLQLSAPLIPQAKTDLRISLLTDDPRFKNTHVAALIGSNPIDELQMHLGANIQTSDSSGTNTHRLSAGATYKIVKDFNIFAEYAITDLSAISANSHLLAGMDFPTLGLLDQCRTEIEYSAERPAETSQIAWMVLLMKKVANVKVNVGVGSDPSGLGSRDAEDVGFFSRVTAAF